MHAFARPDLASPGCEAEGSAAFSFRKPDSVRPNAPSPPTCSKSRRVMPSQRVFGEPSTRSTEASPSGSGGMKQAYPGRADDVQRRASLHGARVVAAHEAAVV